ncbi:MAG: 4Fe-4S dicluster domain-containing protein [Armatimonadota bacterium]
MHWTEEAARALSKAPFFVRKFARRKVEEHVRGQGRDTVTLDDVRGLRDAARGKDDGDLSPSAIEDLVADLTRESEQATVEQPGYYLRVCGGAFGCPRALVDLSPLRDRVVAALEAADLETMLRERHPGPLLRHHKFRVALAACTNACSEPQTKDFGAVGQARPGATGAECTRCGECAVACREQALTVDHEGPHFDRDKCILCGDCVRACPTGHLAAAKAGYGIMLGGRLGRRPRLAREVAALAGEDEVMEMLSWALDVFRRETGPRERFAEAVDRVGWPAGGTAGHREEPAS